MKSLPWNGSLISHRTIRPATAVALPWSQWWHSIELCLDRFLQAFILRGYECCCSPLTVLIWCVRVCVCSGCTSVSDVAGSLSQVGSGSLFSPLARPLLFPCTYTCTNKWGFTLTLEPHQIGDSCEESAGRASLWWAFLSTIPCSQKSLWGAIHRAVIALYNTRFLIDLHAGNPASRKPGRVLNSPHSDNFRPHNFPCHRRGKKTGKFKTSLNSAKQGHLCSCFFVSSRCVSSGFCGN